MTAALILGYPLGQDVYCEALLGASVAFSMTLRLMSFAGWTMGIGFLGILCITQTDIIAWDHFIKGPDSASILFLAIIVFLFLIFGHMRRRSWAAQITMRNRIASIGYDNS